MSPPGDAALPAAVATLPTDRHRLLAGIAPERQKLFRLVRQILDELDEAAPWDDLYYPPDSPEAFLGMTAGLLGVVEQIPGRIRALVDLLGSAAGDEETRQTLEEADYYFAGIHNMCAHDLGRLRSLLEPHSAEGAGRVDAAERSFLCEVVADLKGKYASALMGATSSIVAEGSWSGVDVEPVLFPEKAEEFRRNGDLLRALRRALDAIAEVREQIPFRELIDRWRSGTRADPYTLADLATFRGLLGQLLKRGVRRALYSGDYHQIQRREAALATRIAELEATHHRTWSEPLESADASADLYRRMVRNALEIGAILDVGLLEQMLGSRTVRELRTAAAAFRTGDFEVPARSLITPELAPLVPLLAEEDLASFLELLLGSVMKRASIAAATREQRPAPAPAPAVMAAPLPPPSPAPERASREVLPDIAELEAPPAKLPAAASRPPSAGSPAPAAAAPRAAAAQPPPPAVLPAASLGERHRDTIAGLHQLLLALQAPENPQWSAFRMLQRLTGRHTRVPPSLIQGAQPFVYEVLNTLVPQLEAAAALGAIPAEARRNLVDCCLALTDDRLTPAQMMEEVPTHLVRLQRLLEVLTSTTGAQLRPRAAR